MALTISGGTFSLGTTGTSFTLVGDNGGTGINLSTLPDGSNTLPASCHTQAWPALGGALGSTSTVTKAFEGTFTLVAGTLTIDLTALTDRLGAPVNGTNLRPNLIIFTNPLGNSSFFITAGSYLGLVSANTATLAIPVGQSVHFSPSQLPLVTASLKTLVLTGTGTQTINCFIGFGA
jgi:hypothetical protein